MKCFISIFILVLLAGCAGNDADTGKKQKQFPKSVLSDTAALTTIHWINSLKPLGNVKPKEKTAITFAFENTGNNPLYIISATPGCGCTIADYPKQAIPPGAQGVITASYSAPDDAGQEFRKSISVTANTKENTNHTLFFFGQIGDKPAKRVTGEVK